MIPAWLEVTIGDVWRSARLRRCTRCKAPILTGLDAPRCALTVRADPTPLTPLGETLALLAGRTTYDLIDAGGRKELNYRQQDHITGERKRPVLASHQCGKPLTEHTERTPNRIRYFIPEEPQF